MNNTFLSLLLGVLFLWGMGCERPEIDNSDKDYPIDISVALEANQVRISWTETNISTFDSYIVLRSLDSIPDDVNGFGAFGISQVGIVQEFDESEILDEEVPFAEKLYYKVLVSIGDRFLVSPTVSIDFERTILPIRYFRFFNSSGGNYVYLWDNNQNNAFQVDLRNDQASFISNFFLNFQANLGFGMNNGNSEVYLLNQTNTINIFKETDLLNSESFTVSSSVFYAASQNDLLFLSTRDFGGPLLVYRRSTKNFLNQHDYDDWSDPRSIALLSETENKLILSSRTQLDYFSLNATGAQLEHGEFEHFNFLDLRDQPVVSPDGAYILPYTQGKVYTTDPLGFHADITSSSQVFSDFAFSEDGTKLYAVKFFAQNVEEYSFPDLQLQSIHNVGATVKNILVQNGELVVFGSFFTQGIEQTFIERIPIQ